METLLEILFGSVIGMCYRGGDAGVVEWMDEIITEAKAAVIALDRAERAEAKAAERGDSDPWEIARNARGIMQQTLETIFETFPDAVLRKLHEGIYLTATALSAGPARLPDVDFLTILRNELTKAYFADDPDVKTMLDWVLAHTSKEDSFEVNVAKVPGCPVDHDEMFISAAIDEAEEMIRISQRRHARRGEQHRERRREKEATARRQKRPREDEVAEPAAKRAAESASPK